MIGGVTGYKIKVRKNPEKLTQLPGGRVTFHSVTVACEDSACTGVLLTHFFPCLQLHALSEPSAAVRTLVLSTDASPFSLRDLTPGASYRLELHSMFDTRDSEVPLVQNFTTRKL